MGATPRVADCPSVFVAHFANLLLTKLRGSSGQIASVLQVSSSLSALDLPYALHGLKQGRAPVGDARRRTFPTATTGGALGPGLNTRRFGKH